MSTSCSRSRWNELRASHWSVSWPPCYKYVFHQWINCLSVKCNQLLLGTVIWSTCVRQRYETHINVNWPPWNDWLKTALNRKEILQSIIFKTRKQLRSKRHSLVKDDILWPLLSFYCIYWFKPTSCVLPYNDYQGQPNHAFIRLRIFIICHPVCTIVCFSDTYLNDYYCYEIAI